MDSSVEAQLNLAKVQRLVGQRYGAVQTLERLLQTEPANESALALLKKIRSSEVPLRNHVPAANHMLCVAVPAESG